jgi:hypothetical protein
MLMMCKRPLKLLTPIFLAFSVSISIPASGERGGGNHQWDQHSSHQRNSKEKKRDKGGNHQNYRGRNHYLPNHFNQRQRAVAHDYFGQRFNRGNCPPGLVRKSHSCLPPGYAKKWRIGYPLPRDVVFYDLPRPLRGQLGYPGPGYRYVRVAADILLIVVGTGMVIDAIEDLSSM